MKVRVQFFSRLKDIVGASEVTIDVPPDVRVRDLLALLYKRTPALRDWDRTILVGAGVEFVERDYVLEPNEDLSIMPPVQGG